ncbi:MAG TPA: MTH938/NDUFAF3 family protein [Patescibacteria group bacterium]|nr:MTH938/NDUFAF3 family protein [Patescibacteria group bacterium]
MIQINNADWGKIEVDGQEYRQVLIIGDEVLERDDKKLHQLFNTTHQIGDWEEELLFSGKPEVMVIGNGFDGVLEVSEKFKARLAARQVQSSKLGIELRILKTPQAVEEFNRLSKEGKRVNALIHTTC